MDVEDFCFGVFDCLELRILQGMSEQRLIHVGVLAVPLNLMIVDVGMCGDAQVRPGGEKARKLLGVRGTPTGVTAKVEIDGAALTFEDLRLVQ